MIGNLIADVDDFIGFSSNTLHGWVEGTIRQFIPHVESEAWNVMAYLFRANLFPDCKLIAVILRYLLMLGKVEK